MIGVLIRKNNSSRPVVFFPRLSMASLSDSGDYSNGSSDKEVDNEPYNHEKDDEKKKEEEEEEE